MRGGKLQSGDPWGLCSGYFLMSVCQGRRDLGSVAEETARELAWEPGKKKRGKKRLKAAEALVRATISAEIIAWALG
jgi:hypothetical protein